MSTDYNHEIGYESLLSDFKRYQKQTPRGVGMTRKGKNIYLQFKTPNTARKPYACNCAFSLDGMVDALNKSKKVKERLEALTSEVEFWNWYEKEIKNESQLVDDRLTFGEAIKKVEDDFWSRPSRTKKRRNRNDPSDVSSWNRTYGLFFKHLPSGSFMNIEDIQIVIAKQEKGTRNYKYAVSAMKKLVKFNKRTDLLESLESIDITQTKNAELQATTLEDFLEWRREVLGITVDLHRNTNISLRKSWLWVFSMQVVYGLRISEVFAIKNLTESYVTNDGVSIPALNEPGNTKNLIYIGEKTIIGTKVKTGARLARPQIPPKYPDLIDRLDLKTVLLPTNKPVSSEHEAIRQFYPKIARRKLARWNAPFTQTHALRHLANINGIQAGIPQEVRAQSMGHTVQMNESVYKKRQSTQTTIDLLLNSNQNAIDFVTALTSIKNLVKTQPEQRQFAAKILSIIYQKSEDEIVELL